MFRSIFLSTIFLLTLFLNARAQQVPIAGDCPEAIVLKINEEYRYEESPIGPGKVMEIESHKHDPQFFEKEHNTVWYKFKAPSAGMLTMELTPFRGADDYDFLIFKADGAEVCDAILNKELTPVLTNISRTSKKVNGRTGLRPNSGKQFVAEGPGEAYSRPLQVQPDEVYYIVVDNVYDGGEGHSIQLKLEKMIHVSGKVVSDIDGKPLNAEIIYENKSTGKVLVKSESNPETGEFDLDLPLEEGVNYNLVINADSHFFKTQTFNTLRVKRQSLVFQVKMPKLVIDKTFPLPDINFKPGLAVFVPSAYPTLRALHRFMKRNKTIDISLEGHVNGVNYGVRMDGSPLFEQELSEDRAAAVKRYLADKKIGRNRMSNRGFGALYMLYPKAFNDQQMAANRRVEVRMGGYSNQGTPIEFAKGNWEEVRAEALRSNRYIMVDAYTTWCPPCSYMSRTVFTDPNVAAYYNPRFVSYKLDMETPEGIAFAQEYGVEAFPTFLFFDPQGDLVSKVVGAKNQLDFIKVGKAAIELEKMALAYEAGNRDHDLLFTYVTNLATVGDIPEEIMAEYKRVCPKGQWYSSNNFYFICDLIDGFRHPYFKELFANRDEFYKVLSPKQVNSFLLGTLSGPSSSLAGANKDQEMQKEIEQLIGELVGNSKEKAVFRARLNYALKAKDLSGFEDAGRNLIELGGHSWRTYYELGGKAATMNTQGSLELAMKWVQKSISVEKNASNTLLEVRLLAKSGDTGGALKHLVTARKKGLEEGRTEASYNKLEDALINQSGGEAIIH